jgi:hypothetical protein
MFLGLFSSEYPMRPFNILALFALVGCSEYNLFNRPPDAEEPPPAPRVPAEVVTTDVYEIEDVECWFKQRSGEYRDFDGDGEREPVELGVVAQPIFLLLTNPELEVQRGEEVHLDFLITSYMECGSFDLHYFYFNVTDQEEGAYEWLLDLLEFGTPAEFGDVVSDLHFEPYPGYNAQSDTPHALSYVWQDEEGQVAFGAAMDTQRVPFYGGRFFRFTWTVPDSAPLNRPFTIDLASIGWTDLETGNRILFDSAPFFQKVEVELTVVE